MNAFDFPPCHGPKPVHHEHWGPKPPVPPCAPGPTPNPYSLIHPFNKVCFKNYTEAVSMLKHKDLIPGEYAFAYYYDKTADFGVNAIGAVGSIKVGAANIKAVNTTLNKVAFLIVLAENANKKNTLYHLYDESVLFINSILLSDSSNIC